MIQTNIVKARVAIATVFGQFHRQVLSLIATSAGLPPANGRSRFEEADGLREFASQQLRVDPRFAEELYAAASRHERAA
ncbi:hypothetical protein [Variovorax sp. LjRoot178]|uniref:hypothetical protein n=1 Tax=Variovorax sp. LjRoot178 TaxID=3342277 RepID=UPI003ECE8ED4